MYSCVLRKHIIFPISVLRLSNLESTALSVFSACALLHFPILLPSFTTTVVASVGVTDVLIDQLHSKSSLELVHTHLKQKIFIFVHSAAY